MVPQGTKKMKWRFEYGKIGDYHTNMYSPMVTHMVWRQGGSDLRNGNLHANVNYVRERERGRRINTERRDETSLAMGMANT